MIPSLEQFIFVGFDVGIWSELCVNKKKDVASRVYGRWNCGGMRGIHGRAVFFIHYGGTNVPDVWELGRPPPAFT